MVYVLDKQGRPLMPCTEKRARLLLDRDRARVHRVVPFVIRLVDRTALDCRFQSIQIKLDPGSKVTGAALVRLSDVVDVDTGEVRVHFAVVSLMELTHRGHQITEALTQRAGFRRRRRANLRYRAPQFLNRGNKGKGWLAPSLQHRGDSTLSWVRRLSCWTPVTSISCELVRFDMQALESPDIEGAAYQRGTLFGTEVREYLLAKWNRQCAYCDASGIPLQLEHIQPKARGGSNRVSNLTLACAPCNTKKAAQDISVFLAKDATRLKRILAHTKRPLKDAAAVNATRLALVATLKQTGLPVETGTGGRTKWNREQLGVPKGHALDALCVGLVDSVSNWANVPVLTISCRGRGAYKRTRLDRFGFPRGHLMRAKSVYGFQTGDHVRAAVPAGKNKGLHTGRIAIRASGSFNISTTSSVIQGISYRHCIRTQRSDGYGYLHSTTRTKAPIALQSAPVLSGLNAGVSRSNAG